MNNKPYLIEKTSLPVEPKMVLASLPKLMFQNLKELFFFCKFIIILILFSLLKIFEFLTHLKFVGLIFKPFYSPIQKLFKIIVDFIDSSSNQEISAIDLISLAYNELSAKKTRTIVTIGGMGIGFGLIIFLLSIGYGLEKLVISRVASLNELRQADILTGQATALNINDDIINEIQKSNLVEIVFPQISLVAKVKFNNSVSDAVVYGVTSRYLSESAIKPSAGHFFTDEEYAALPKDPQISSESESGEVAGASVILNSRITRGRELGKVRYAIFPLTWIPVYSSPDEKSPIIGYTNRQTGEQEATEVWGNFYQSSLALLGEDLDENQYSSWIQDNFPIWEKTTCTLTEADCIDGNYKIKKSVDKQMIAKGYIREEHITLDRYMIVSDSINKPTFGLRLNQVSFYLSPNKQTPIYLSPNLEMLIDQEVVQADSQQSKITGTLLYGQGYFDNSGFGSVVTENSKNLGYWIEASLPTWYEVKCNDNCTDLYLPKLDASGNKTERVVYLKVVDVEQITPPLKSLDIQDRNTGSVLGERTENDNSATNISSTSNSATNSSQLFQSDTSKASNSATAIFDLGINNLGDELDWASIASQAGIVQPKSVDILPTPNNLKKVAVVNSAFLSMLGVPLEKAINSTFHSSFVFDGKLFGDSNYRAESESIEYKIIGVLPDNKSPFFYIPFSDAQSFSVNNYSQLQVMAKENEDLAKIRSDVEAMGFKTSSVVDTVERITSLFQTVRIVLTAVGLVALAVASLGMFNTLTVSLLEKTRQVGLMKAMGMKSREVKRLFLAESVIMGVTGGLVGLIGAFIFGKIISAVLTSLSLTQGEGVINLTYIPLPLILFVMACAFLIGITTGWYPSYRATRISALNALRYE